MGLFWSKGKRRNEPWEVVCCEEVEPVSVCDDDDDEDFDISHIAGSDISRLYVFDITKSKHFRDALVFARQQLLQELAGTNYNMLFTEGWRFTLYRRGEEYRAHVKYSGRPAYSLHKHSQHGTLQRLPPFIGVLDTPKKLYV